MPLFTVTRAFRHRSCSRSWSKRAGSAARVVEDSTTTLQVPCLQNPQPRPCALLRKRSWPTEISDLRKHSLIILSKLDEESSNRKPQQGTATFCWMGRRVWPSQTAGVPPNVLRNRNGQNWFSSTSRSTL